MIALLAGTLGAFGCSDDKNGTGGTGGTGGGAAEPCTGGKCTPGSTAKADCEDLVEGCEAAGAGGAGGAGGASIPPESCGAIGFGAFCSEGGGGTGGSGGTGGTGGSGGDLGCNVLGCVDNGDLKAKCEAAVEACFIHCAIDDPDECQEDECLAIGLLICNVTGG
jgi:hypothetical protein